MPRVQQCQILKANQGWFNPRDKMMNPPNKWPQSFLNNFAAAAETWMAYMESKIISYHFCSKREVVITSFGQQTISCLLLDKRMDLILAKNRLKSAPIWCASRASKVFWKRLCSSRKYAWQANDTHMGERKTKDAQINEFKYWLLGLNKKVEEVHRLTGTCQNSEL